MIRWGFMGAGGVSRQFAASLRHLSDARAWAVTSRTPERARAFAHDFGIGHWHTDYDTMLADPALDVVYVATPTAYHDEHALKAIAAGKAVLVEKPFAVTPERARRVVEAARAAGVFCMEGMWMRFMPAMQALERMIAAGDIGEPRLLQAELGFQIPYDERSRYYSAELGGGALLDLGVYLLWLAHSLLGKPRGSSAEMIRSPTGVDEQMSIVLRYEHALASLSCGFVNRARNNALIVGTAGTIHLHAPLYAPKRLTLERSSTRGRADVEGIASGWRNTVERSATLVAIKHWITPIARALLGKRRRFRHGFRGFGYQFEAAEVARCLEQGELESPIVPLADSIAVLELVERLKRQALRAI